jgi:hypothetical protein
MCLCKKISLTNIFRLTHATRRLLLPAELTHFSQKKPCRFLGQLYIVTYRPISRQRPKYARATIGAVFSIARKQPARQGTGLVAITWEPKETRVISVRGPCREDIRDYGNGNSVKLSLGDSQGKLEIEEELEVSL